MLTEHLLDVKDLSVDFQLKKDVMQAVTGVNLHINKGEIVGLVGESGCGKSVTALTIMRLLPRPPAIFSEGRVLFKGDDLLKKSKFEMSRIRGKDISMIFQEPMTALNPVFTCGNQMVEPLELHLGLSRKRAIEKSIELLNFVGVPQPDLRINDYPYQLSGGMQQRVMIAMALSCNPELLIADEPTTALDVTIQAQILELLKDLQRKLSMAVLLITHDLFVIAEMAQRVIVMYAGQIVEESDVRELFNNPQHPYTIGLLESTPRLGSKKSRLFTIEGNVPNPLEMPKGCRFYPRCSKKMSICQDNIPVLKKTKYGNRAACWSLSL